MSSCRQSVYAYCLSKPQSSPQSEEKQSVRLSWLKAMVILGLTLISPYKEMLAAPDFVESSFRPYHALEQPHAKANIAGLGIFQIEWYQLLQKAELNPSAMVAASSFGDFVWKDCDQDGIQDPGEEGLADVPVNLVGTTVFGESVDLTTLTNALGAYSFIGLDAGLYTISFGLPLSSSGVTYTLAEQGNDSSLDSNVDPATGSTPPITLENNKTEIIYDAGFIDIESPVLSGIPADVTVNCNDIPALPNIGTDITATDNWNASPSITLSTSSTQGTSGACSLYNYLIIRTWTADDECGNSTAEVQIITVKDGDKPDLVGVPADITIDLSQGEVIPPVANVTAIDICDPSPSVSISESDAPNGNCGFIRTRTWTGEDACGNQTQQSQVITVISGSGGTASSNSPVCGGEDLLLFADGGTSYSWTGPGGFSSNQQNPVIPNASPLNAGTYTVEISGGQCGGVITLSVDVSAGLALLPIITNATCDDPGSITLSVSGGTGPFNFDWADLPGSSDPADRNGLIPGTYSIVVTDVNNCSVTENNLVVGDDCGCFADAGTITPESSLYCTTGPQLIGATPDGNANVPSGFSTIYVLTSGAGLVIEQVNTIPQFVVDGEGQYTIHTLIFDPLTLDLSIIATGVTTGFDVNALLIQGGGNICGALDVAGAAINVSMVNFSIDNTTDATCGNSDGTALLSPTNNNYSWSDGGFGATRNDLAAGTYTVVATNIVGCTASFDVVIADNCICEAPEVADIVTFGSSCGEANGSAAITVVGNPADFLFEWTPAGGTPNATNDVRTDLVAGVYTVKISDPSFADCSTEVTFLVSNVDGPEVTDIDVTPASCFFPDGGATLLPAINTYVWTIDNVVANTRNDLPAGIYEVRVFDNAVPPCPNVVFVEIPVENPLEVVPVVNSLPDCNQDNGSVTLQVNGGNGSYAFSWGPDATRDDLIAGTYTVTVTDFFNGCTAEVFFTLANNVAAANISVAEELSTSCSGADDVLVDFSVSFDAGFASPGDTLITDGTFNYTADDLLGPGDYCIIINDANGCLAGESCFSVVEPSPIIVDVTLNDKTCQQAGSIVLEVSGGNGGYTFDWTDLAGANDPQNRTDLQEGAFGVIITDDGGCSRSITGLTINNTCPFSCVNPEVLNTLVIEATCGASNGAITLEMVGNPSQYNYTWFPDLGVGDENKKTALPAGVYEVTVTNASDPSCFVTRSIAVGNSDGPQATIVSTSPAFCAQLNGAAILEPPSFIYEWCNGVVGFNPNNLPGGTCAVTVTDPATGCINILEVEIETLNVLEAEPIVVNQPDCNVANGTVDFQIVGGSGNYDILWEDGSVGAPRTGLAGGVYTVTVTDLGVSGCVTTTTFGLTEVVAPGAELVLNSTTPIILGCVGDDDATVNFNVNYATGFSFPADTVITDGTDEYQNGSLGVGAYCILIRDASGCLAAEACFEVEDPQAMDVVASITQKTCTDPGAIQVVVSGGTGPFVFDWEDIPGTNDGQNRTGLDAGIYDLTITDANGCEAIAENIIVIDECDPCPATESIFEIIPTNEQDVNCVQLESCFDAALTTYVLLDGGFSGASSLGDFTVDANGCLEYNSGNIPGLDTICVIAQFGGASDTTCFVYEIFEVPLNSPVTDTIYLTTIELTPVDSCLDVSELGGVYTSSSIFEAPINGTGDLTIIDNCVNYSPSLGSVGPFIDTMTVVICNDVILTCDTTVIIVTVEPAACSDIYLGADTLKADSCQGFARLCLDIPLAQLLDYTFTDNGSPFTGSFEQCVVDTSFQYVATPLGAPGVFELLSWEVNGTDFNIPLFTSIAQLADSMVVWDPAGNWQLTGFVLTGGAPGTTYGDLVISVAGGPAVNIPAQIINDAIAMLLDPGTHDLTIIDSTGVCDYNFQIEVVCDTVAVPSMPDTLLNVFVGETDTLCFPGLLPIISVDNLCPGDSDGNAFVQPIAGTNCIEYSGILLGQDTFCLELCDGVVCDTSIIVINVLPVLDTIPVFTNIGLTDTFCMDTTMFQHPIDTFYNYCESASGAIVDFEILDGTVCIEYTSFDFGSEPACLVACDTAGYCDTTILLVNVIAPTIEVIDTTVLLGDTDTICLDASELIGEVDTFYNFCDRDAGVYVEFFLEEDSLCVVYEGISVGTDSACLVICDEFGICDTTYLYVTTIVQPDSLLPVAVNDTVMTTSAMDVEIEILFNDTINGNLLNIVVVEEPLNGVVTSSAFNLVYLPDPGFCDGIDSFTYAIQNEVGWDTATVYIEVMCSELIIYTGFSPNGDNTNDTWTILGIERFPDNTVKVYNRWGNLVYQEQGYINSNGWDGTWNGEALPDGTYFYIIDNGEGEVFNGYIQLQR